ncbi:MAG: cytochrome C oxidase subunit IV family protein [Oceanospirillaceae bacterium]
MKILMGNIHFAGAMLLLLTIVSTWLAQSGISVGIVAALVTLSVIVKGQLIVDTFMELYQAPSKWRYLLLSYVVLVPSILAAILFSFPSYASP